MNQYTDDLFFRAAVAIDAYENLPPSHELSWKATIDILSSWARVQGLKVVRAEDRKLAERLGRLVGEQAKVLLDQALRLLDPVAWLEEAKKWTKAYDDCVDLGDEVDRCVKAISLIEALDDADMVVWAAKKLGFEAQTAELLVRQLKDCHTWLKDNESFCLVPARNFVKEALDELKDDAPGLEKFHIVQKAAKECDWNLAALEAKV